MMKTKLLILVSLLSLSFVLCGCSVIQGNKTTTPSTKAITTTTKEPTTITPTTTEIPNLLDKWEETDCYSFYYKQLGKDVMPIGGWCAPPQKYNTDEQYALLKESGLNSIYGLYERVGIEDAEVTKALEYSSKYGIVYLVRDASLGAYAEDESEFVEHISKFTKYSSFGGVLVKDEPDYSQFDNLAVVRTMFRKYFSSSLCYVNMFPSYAASSQLDGNGSQITYEEYLRSYVKTVKPQMLSYDFYGIYGKYPNISSGHFEQLYLAATIANENKIPFWCFIATSAYGGASRVPTEAELYWQVNTALAYGCKGIQYFCYFHPVEFTNSGIVGGSFVDGNGKPTEIFGYGQKINAQIARMDEVLMHSTLVSQMVYGESPSDPIEQENLVESFREVEEIETDGDLIVGCFDYNGKTVLYVANNSTLKTANVLINFNKYIEARVYGAEETIEKSGNYIDFKLEAGEGTLIELTNYR